MSHNADHPPIVDFDLRRQPKLYAFYKGHAGTGSVSQKRVFAGVGIAFGITTVLYYGLGYIGQKMGGPPPRTLSKEWQEAERERRLKQNSTAISDHKIGRPITNYEQDENEP